MNISNCERRVPDDAVASWLLRLTPDRAFRVGASVGILLCVLGKDTSLSQVPANLLNPDQVSSYAFLGNIEMGVGARWGGGGGDVKGSLILFPTYSGRRRKIFR